MKNPAELDVNAMRRAASEASTMLRTLANEERLLLLCQLSQGECSVGELEQMLDIHQPTLSQQLGVLRKEALVATRREGRQIYYSVKDATVLTLLKTLYALYCEEPEGSRRAD